MFDRFPFHNQVKPDTTDIRLVELTGHNHGSIVYCNSMVSMNSYCKVQAEEREFSAMCSGFSIYS